jgi:hypothetical protein
MMSKKYAAQFARLSGMWFPFDPVRVVLEITFHPSV